MKDLTHVDETGRARMVDISRKAPVRRRARAAGRITLLPETVQRIRNNMVSKGDVLSVARIAGITAAKRTGDLIPLCHSIAMEHVDIDFTILDDAVEISCSAVCSGKTGIEMEALTGVSVAALTIYDMCKAVDRSMSISDIRLVEKSKEPM